MKQIMTLAFSILTLSGCIVTTDTFDGNLRGRGAETVACTPGALVEVGCGALGLGSCSGDPILTVCDGDIVHELDCGESGFSQLARNDDFNFSQDRCPGLDVVCPASGLLAIRPTAFGGSDAVCNWEAAE